MNVEYSLIENGYEIKPSTEYFLVSYAENRKTGDKFYFSVRKKQTATYRRISGEWEFGVDAPDHVRYYAPSDKIPFLVFFETENPPRVNWIVREQVGRLGRRWTDPDHFPEGIFFVKVSDTIKWEPGTPFTHRPETGAQKPAKQEGLTGWIGEHDNDSKEKT